MFDYICGRISIVNPNYITIDNNNIGYKIFVPNPYSFEEEKEYKIFLYSYVREEEFLIKGEDDDGDLVGALGLHFHGDLALLRGEFDGVAQQIIEDAQERLGVAFDDDMRSADAA